MKKEEEIKREPKSYAERDLHESDDSSECEMKRSFLQNTLKVIGSDKKKKKKTGISKDLDKLFGKF